MTEDEVLGLARTLGLSDVERTMSSGPPRWYRHVYDHRLRTQNLKEFRRWLDDPDYDPVLQVRHRHSAKWSWR